MKIKHIRNVVAMLSAMAFTATSASAALVLGIDFQTAPGPVLNATGSVQQSYAANFGTGTLYMDGTNGSSTWINAGTGGTGTDTQLIAYYGTSVNAGTGFSTSAGTSGTTAGGGSIGLRQPDNATNRGVNTNGFGIVFKFSMTGYQDLGISYAANRFDAAGAYDTVTWTYSTDAATWNAIDTTTLPGTAGWNAYSLATTTGLDNASTAYVRAVFTGALGNPTGSERVMLDNFQFNATVIPEPATGAMLMVGLGLWVAVRRVRKRTAA